MHGIIIYALTIFRKDPSDQNCDEHEPLILPCSKKSECLTYAGIKIEF